MAKLKNILPFFLSAVFIASGLSKLFTINFFEQFIYSFELLSLNQAIVFARLVIATELTIGLLYLFRIYIKSLSYITLGLLVVFTVFIAILEITKTADDCHCFGTLIQLSNTTSIIKNIVLIVCTILIIKVCPTYYKAFPRTKFWSSIIIALVVSFAVKFPGNLFGIKQNITYCETCFEDFVTKNELSGQKKLICFFSIGCKYCKLAAKSISVISQKTGNEDDILYVLWDDKQKLEKFFQDSNTKTFQTIEMHPVKFLELINGKMPLIVLYNNGKVEQTYRYNDLDEKTVIKFLEK